MTEYVTVLDIGGTSIKAALLDRDGAESWTRRWPTLRERGPDAVVGAVLDAAGGAVAEGIRRYGAAPAAVGVACLGAVDEVAGVARHAGAVGWRDVPLRELISQHTGVPVAFGHDLRTAALAEARFGAGRKSADFFFMAIGTGIGAALVVGGAPLTGAHGLAGELGHIVIEPNGLDCACGARGCLEAEASATGIARRFAQRSGHEVSAHEVARLCAAGDPHATEVWAITVQRLARGLSTVSALLDPSVIVIGGGVSLAGDLLFDPLRTAFAEDFRLGPAPRVESTPLGDRAAYLGAGMLAWQAADVRAGAR